MNSSEMYLQMRGICKSFHGVHALRHVDFCADRGQVTALCGENGAGKSTLIKILGGIHRRDAGEILLDGAAVKLDTPLEAMQNGISIIHQELNVLPNLSIAENLFVGREKKKGLFVDRAYYRRRAQELLKIVDLNVDPNTLVRYLSTAQKQLVEILRAVASDAKIIVMDEPTSSLTNRETEKLYEIIGTLKARQVGIIYISHRMEEILRLADRAVIFRDGIRVGALDRSEMTEDKIITMMVGRKLTELYAKKTAKIGKPVLEARDLRVRYIQNVSFTVHEGEILGFSGLVGAGRSEIMRLIFGIDKKEGGTIYMDGRPVEIRSAADAIRLGIAMVPEDRKEQALILGMSVQENLTLAVLKQLKQGLFCDKSRENSVAEAAVQRLRIVTPSIGQKVKNLSGGNQQKVVLGKWIETKPRVLILDEPTRGIDVGAKKEIHELMSELAGQGVAIIMISSELPEIIGMSDRIIIMHEGRVKGELPGPSATQEKIMQIAMTG